MIVLDASAALEVLLRGPAAPAVESRMFAPGEALHVPHLIDLEVAQVLRRHVLGGLMSPRERRRSAGHMARVFVAPSGA